MKIPSFPSHCLFITFLLAAPSVQGAVLFSDTFDDPAGSVNATPNTSVSGVYADTNANNYGGISMDASENGVGIATLDGTTSQSGGLVYLLDDLSGDSDIAGNGSMTIDLGTFTPPAGDSWISLVVQTTPFHDNTAVNQSQTILGLLFEGDGDVQAFESGSGGGVVGDWGGGTGDISVELTGITGLGTGAGSFDYEVFAAGNSIYSESAAGDLSGLFVGLEVRGAQGSVGDLEIASVPEPSTALLGALGVFGLLRRRR